MGRVYDVSPDVSKGERRGYCRVEQLGFASWSHVPYATRIEFDNDADIGPALVTALQTDESGQIVVADGQILRHQFRAHIRVIHKPGEVPEPAPVSQG